MIIYPRNDINIKEVVSQFPFINEISTKNSDRISYTTKGKNQLIYLKSEQFHGSSTDFRKKNSNQNENEKLIPPEVYEYIKKNGLYGK
jgi:nicotinic acid mononucleotide adenylyltransferase